MTEIDRRRLLHRTAQSFLILPLLMPLAVRAQAPARGRFAPPSTPMVYTRQLSRMMAGGARFMVTRSFAVRFTNEGQGYLVSGSQSGVEVVAPAALERFAALERERIETGLFPLHLDLAGQIPAPQPDGRPAVLSGEGLTKAVAAARDVLSRMDVPPDAQAQLSGFLGAVHQSATQMVTRLPSDLFAPQQLTRTDRQSLDLPTDIEGDLRGDVTVQFTATVDPATGLMRSAQRSVTTSIGADQRETIESWTLKPA